MLYEEATSVKSTTAVQRLFVLLIAFDKTQRNFCNMSSSPATPPKTSTPKAIRSNSKVYVCHITPSLTGTLVSNGNSRNGCLSNSGSYEDSHPNGNGTRTNGNAGGSSLENSCSSQEIHDADTHHQAMGEREKSRDGVNQDGSTTVTEEGFVGNSEGVLPKIMTSKRNERWSCVSLIGILSTH